MSLKDNSFDVEEKEAVDNLSCIGLKFRGRVSRYRTATGIIEKKEIRLLKRKSCPGCEKCGWILDYFDEMGFQDPEEDDILSNIENGKIYEPNIHGGNDWETGIWELDYIDFKEVKD